VITIKDVAGHAGVDSSTVSYVLNGRAKEKRISDETCRKVISAAAKLDYLPNVNAIAVKRGATRVIGVLGTLLGDFVMNIFRGIADEAMLRGYALQPRTVNLAADIAAAVEGCMRYRCRGVIAIDSLEGDCPPLLEAARKFGIPLVLVDPVAVHPRCPSVEADDQGGVRIAVAELFALGHRRVGFLGNPDLQRHFAGYRDALRDAGLESDPSLCCFVGISGGEIGDSEHTAMVHLIAKGRPSAVICASDPLAMQLYKVAGRRGLRIPEDLSVVGFTDTSYAVLANPPLTTVAKPHYEMGRASMTLLHDLLEGVQTPERVVLPTRQVHRQSHAAARSA